MRPACTHPTELDSYDVGPSSDGCEDCRRQGGEWLHLRICMTCGHVGCCDSSPGRHASGHFHSAGHPLVRSFEPGEDWWWCYADQDSPVVTDAPPAPSHP